MKILNKIIFIMGLINGSAAVMSMDSDDAFENSHCPSHDNQHINTAHRTVSRIKNDQEPRQSTLSEHIRPLQNMKPGKATKKALERRELVLDKNRGEQIQDFVSIL